MLSLVILNAQDRYGLAPGRHSLRRLVSYQFYATVKACKAEKTKNLPGSKLRENPFFQNGAKPIDQYLRFFSEVQIL